jgi:hypothetical protein
MTLADRIARARYTEGRDEMNLADFPISVLQRQQPLDKHGGKKDTAVYSSCRYDPRSRHRVQQRVILESSSRHGLPTPADENVVLALLFVAKHTHNFSSPRVHFAPRRLFQIMGWAPNSRSYERLRDVLRRLKALVIRYENSWWDIEGREYEAEVATGIISEYELARQVSGRKKAGSVPPSWVHWSPQFQQSLSKGNLKKLNLELLFSLRLPTSQRMYRFLDKRFYQSAQVEMDLRDFACGHIGLTAVDNIAELKRRLAPALDELEAIGFLARAEAEERYHKVGTGAWRIRLRPGMGNEPEVVNAGDKVPDEVAVEATLSESPPLAAEEELLADFYAQWDARKDYQPGESDRRQAAQVVTQLGAERARALLPFLVRVLRRRWPECKTFTGAVDKYGPDAVHLLEQTERRSAAGHKDREQYQREREEQQRLDEERRCRELLWRHLGEEERQRIAEDVLLKHPRLKDHPAILHALCLSQLRPHSDA